MTDEARLRIGLGLLALALSLVLMPGCMQPTSALQLTSYKDPYFPETYSVAFTECAYSVDAGGDYHIVGRATRIPADGSEATVTQLLHIHLFWNPEPGKTFDHPSSVDATIRYAIVTERGTSVHCGTGFVFLERQRMSDRVVARVEAARLRPASQHGEPTEVLGDARVTGTLVAERDACLAIDLRRELDLHSGPDETP